MIVLAYGSPNADDGVKASLPTLMKAAETALSIAETGHIQPGQGIKMQRGSDKVSFDRAGAVEITTASGRDRKQSTIRFGGLPEAVEDRPHDAAIALANDLIARMDSLRNGISLTEPDLSSFAAAKSLLALAANQEPKIARKVEGGTITMPWRGDPAVAALVGADTEWTFSPEASAAIVPSMDEHEWCCSSKSGDFVLVSFEKVTLGFEPAADMPAAMRHIERLGIAEGDLALVEIE